MKKTILALAVALVATPVAAADLGGNSCSDLEERIAELEATTARKGNRKVTVEITGQISKSMLWVDGGDPAFLDNPNSPSRFAIRGTAKISPNVRAGYVLEVGAGNALTIRHNYLWLEEKRIGRISLGHTSQATDGITEITTANTAVANLPTALFSTIAGVEFTDGLRRDVVRYDTPTLGGFTASASWSNGDTWDVALRYAGEFGGLRFAAGGGYAEGVDLGTVVIGHFERMGGSASLMHVGSGLFINGMFSRIRGDVIPDNVDTWLVAGGIERNFFGIGSTTLFGEYGRLEVLGSFGDGWGGGIVQAIDAGAMDLFASYREIEGVSVFHTGARIKF